MLKYKLMFVFKNILPNLRVLIPFSKIRHSLRSVYFIILAYNKTHRSMIYAFSPLNRNKYIEILLTQVV